MYIWLCTSECVRFNCVRTISGKTRHQHPHAGLDDYEMGQERKFHSNRPHLAINQGYRTTADSSLVIGTMAAAAVGTCKVVVIQLVIWISRVSTEITFTACMHMVPVKTIPLLVNLCGNGNASFF